MSSYARDTTWTVNDADGNCLIELDVRAWGNFILTSNGAVLLAITDVKSLFRKHGKLVEYDLPSDLKAWCMRDLEAIEGRTHEWADEVADDIKQSAEDALGDAQREAKEDD